MSCFQLLFCLDYCLYETLSSWQCLSFLWMSFSSLFLIMKSCSLCDNSVVYSTSLVSNNDLGSNKCSFENNFHFLDNVWFPIALLFGLLSVWNFIQLRMSIFTLHVIFLLVPIMKSCTLCDNCVVYSTSLVSNNYLGSNKCSVENNSHFLDNVCFPIALLFRPLSMWKIIQFRMYFFTLHVISPLLIIRKAVLCAINVLYTVPL